MSTNEGELCAQKASTDPIVPDKLSGGAPDSQNKTVLARRIHQILEQHQTQQQTTDDPHPDSDGATPQFMNKDLKLTRVSQLARWQAVNSTRL